MAMTAQRSRGTLSGRDLVAISPHLLPPPLNRPTRDHAKIYATRSDPFARLRPVGWCAVWEAQRYAATLDDMRDQQGREALLAPRRLLLATSRDATRPAGRTRPGGGFLPALLSTDIAAPRGRGERTHIPAHPRVGLRTRTRSRAACQVEPIFRAREKDHRRRPTTR